MNVRAIALALPLVVGIAACKTSSTQGSSGQTASATEPSQSSQNQTTGTPDRQAGGEASASATVHPGAGTAQGGVSGDTSGAYGTGSASGSASTSGDVKAHASDEVLSGKVSRVSEKEIAIQSDTGEEKTLALAPETVVTIDGRDAHQTDLKEGQEVRASYNTVYGRETAVEIRADTSGGTMHEGGMMQHEGGTMGPGSMHGTDMGAGSTGSTGDTGTTQEPSSGTTSSPDTTPPDTKTK